MAVAIQWPENVPLKINGSSKLWQRLSLHAALRARAEKECEKEEEEEVVSSVESGRRGCPGNTG